MIAVNNKYHINFIEQLNQTFSHRVSLKAVDFLCNEHPEILALLLNLGTELGADIETTDCSEITAQVFAATSPNRNNKLNKNIQKVSRIH